MNNKQKQLLKLVLDYGRQSALNNKYDNRYNVEQAMGKIENWIKENV